MNYYCLSDIGKFRKNNEDYCKGEIVYINDEPVGIFALADGMGGHKKGEVASEMAVENIITFIKNHLLQSDTIKFDYIDDIIKQAYNEVNNMIFKKSKESFEFLGMGTTLVLAVIYKDSLCVANVGDSRCYILKDNNLKCITVDHSVVEELIRLNVITSSEAKNHPRKNQITRAVGTEPIVVVDIFKETLNKNDKIVLASDGLTGFVEESIILDILCKENDIEYAVKKLINSANDNSGKDNISVLLVENN